MPLDSRRFESRLKDLLKVFEEEVPKAAYAAAMLTQEEVARRSPSHADEYNMLMVGEQGLSNVPLEGDRSGDTDGRIRFQKEPDTWLKDVAISPLNREVVTDGTLTTVNIGNVPLLEASSVFDYTNLGKGKVPIEHQAGPYFSFFEHGASYVVLPKHQLEKQYPLRPDEASKFHEYPKSIKAFNAYLPEVLGPMFHDITRDRLTALKFNV